MNNISIVTTFLGGMVFSFLLQVIWARLVRKFGSFGGMLAAMLISGTMWILNHGISRHLVYQSSSVWIDMSWAAAIGGICFSLFMGKSLKKATPNLFAATIGGILSGLFINFLTK